MGNIEGAVLGGFLLGLVETFTIAYLPGGSDIKDAIAFLILFLILLVRPNGILGRGKAEHLVFILADPVMLLPSTWKYLLYYVQEGTMTHHGYLVMGRFYFNDPSHLREGMPIYFYPLLLTLKTPLPVLVALVVGMVETWKRRNEPGPLFLIVMFLFWIVPYSLMSAKWLRYISILDAHGLHHCRSGRSQSLCVGIGSGKAASATPAAAGTGRGGWSGIPGSARLG